MDFNDSKYIVTDSFDAASEADTVVSPVIHAAGFGAIQFQLSEETGDLANATSVNLQASVSGVDWTDMRTHGGAAASTQPGVDRAVGKNATYGIQGRFRLIRFVMHTPSSTAATAKLHIHLARI